MNRVELIERLTEEFLILNAKHREYVATTSFAMDSMDAKISKLRKDNDYLIGIRASLERRLEELESL